MPNVNVSRILWRSDATSATYALSSYLSKAVPGWAAAVGTGFQVAPPIINPWFTPTSGSATMLRRMQTVSISSDWRNVFNVLLFDFVGHLVSLCYWL